MQLTHRYFLSACPVGHYKANTGDHSCFECPVNSETRSNKGQTICQCIKGYYRAKDETAEKPCTSEFMTYIKKKK